MSSWHGGKGSAPRPYSVDQQKFQDNWEKTFGKKQQAEEPKAVEKPDCWCYNCNKDYYEPGSYFPYTASRMILCPTCGNKRCPHATNHTEACTNSNEPGQPGSRY